MRSSNKARCANKTKGTLLFIEGKPYFRVYKSAGQFIDYLIAHSDLTVVIDDWDGFFYDEGTDDPFIDHSPETLGIND